MSIPLGERIRRARRTYGMSQAELARRVGISITAMNDIEQGKSADPRFSIVSRIARVLRVDLRIFAGEEDLGSEWQPALTG